MQPVLLIRVPDIFWSGRNGELEATEPVAEIRRPDNIGVVWQQTDVADTQVAAEHTVEVKLVQACPGLSQKKTPVTNDIMFFFFLGWCSAQPRMSLDKFGLGGVFCCDLCVGDVCLPSDHADVVRTLDLCNRFR